MSTFRFGSTDDGGVRIEPVFGARELRDLYLELSPLRKWVHISDLVDTARESGLATEADVERAITVAGESCNVVITRDLIMFAS